MGVFFVHQENAGLRKSAARSGNEIAVRSQQGHLNKTTFWENRPRSDRNTAIVVFMIAAEDLGGPGGPWRMSVLNRRRSAERRRGRSKRAPRGSHARANFMRVWTRIRLVQPWTEPTIRDFYRQGDVNRGRLARNIISLPSALFPRSSCSRKSSPPAEHRLSYLTFRQGTHALHIAHCRHMFQAPKHPCF